MDVPGEKTGAGAVSGSRDAEKAAIKDEVNREFLRAENEDDDGYDPYSDRRSVSEPLFQRDPWA